MNHNRRNLLGFFAAGIALIAGKVIGKEPVKKSDRVVVGWIVSVADKGWVTFFNAQRTYKVYLKEGEVEMSSEEYARFWVKEQKGTTCFPVYADSADLPEDMDLGKI